VNFGGRLNPAVEQKEKRKKKGAVRSERDEEKQTIPWTEGEGEEMTFILESERQKLGEPASAV